jgi:transcriptional regulator with XRE-family HTH domain
LTLRKLRENKGFSVREVSKKAGMTKQHLNFLENGKRRPSLLIANNIAKALNEPLEVINNCFIK